MKQKDSVQYLSGIFVTCMTRAHREGSGASACCSYAYSSLASVADRIFSLSRPYTLFPDVAVNQADKIVCHQSSPLIAPRIARPLS